MEISIKFDDREKENLDEINAALKNLRAESLEILSCKGYLAREEQRNSMGELLEQYSWYGFDEIKLRLNKGADRFRFKLAAVVIPSQTDMSIEEFHDRWNAENVGRILRYIKKIEYKQAQVFLIAYHTGGPEYVL